MKPAVLSIWFSRQYASCGKNYYAVAMAAYAQVFHASVSPNNDFSYSGVTRSYKSNNLR